MLYALIKVDRKNIKSYHNTRTVHNMTALQSFHIFFLPTQFICCVGVLANLMLLIAFIKDPLKCFRNSATYLVGSLAFSDMLFSALIMTIRLGLWTNNQAANILEVLLVYSSMLTIFSIALDRYIMITYPFHHRFLMSGPKMAIWIVVTWFLSSIHPMKMIFMKSNVDGIATPVVCSIVIIFTALLYSKTYFTLKKQAKSMIRSKVATQRSQRVLTCKKVKSDERDTIVSMTGSTDVDTNVMKKSFLVQSQIQNKCFKNEAESIRIKDGCVQRQNAYVKRQDVPVENQDVYAKNQSKCAGCDDMHVECDDDRVGRQDERTENENKHAVCRNLHCQAPCAKSESKLSQIQNGSVEKQKNGFIQSESAGKSEEITRCQGFPINSLKNSAVIKNAQEQKFLNTILIIALVVVITVFPATIICQVWLMLEKLQDNQRTTNIVFPVAWAIFSFNFAVNPFIYFFRLKRYRKTFKIIYCCKN